MNTECILCIQTFPSLVILQQHDVCEHNAPYTCTLCGKVVSFVAELKRHISIHLGLKPHINGTFPEQTDDISCNLCDEWFTTTTYLEKHKCVVLEDDQAKLRHRIKMPLTNAEKARNYRIRRDQSAEKRKAYLLAEKLRRERKRIVTLPAMSETEKIIQRERWRETKREQRRKRKEIVRATFPQFRQPRHPAKRKLGSNNNRRELTIDSYIRENNHLRNRLSAEKRKNAELKRQLLQFKSADSFDTHLSIKNERFEDNLRSVPLSI